MSYSYAFVVVNTFLLAVLATGSESGQGPSLVWDGPARAAVYSQPKKDMPKGTTQAVELLRFVTAYKTGIEALVDVTPYSALLKATADTDKKLTFFAFIDTWVGNSGTEDKKLMKMHQNGSCEQFSKKVDAWGDAGRQGNGWQLDADLVFWPKTLPVDVRPRESITLSSGFYGGYSIGGITTHEGKVVDGGRGIELIEGVDFTGTFDASVYPCPDGAKEVQNALKMGETARRVHAARDKSSIESIIEETYNNLLNDIVSMVTVVNTNSTVDRLVDVSYNPMEMPLAPGMPVWYEQEDLEANDQSIGDMSHGKSIGEVDSVNRQAGRATIKITGPCLPANHTGDFLPRIKLERQPGALQNARALADSWRTIHDRIGFLPQHQDFEEAMTMSLLARGRAQPKQANFNPFLVGGSKDHDFIQLPALGQVNLAFLMNVSAASDCAPPVVAMARSSSRRRGVSIFASSALQTSEQVKPTPEADVLVKTGNAPSSAEMTMNEGDRVCVLATRATGRVFERTFDMPTLQPAKGDRVLLQFAVTGHGWSGSTEQCGEFCHAIYHIKVNGKQAWSITEWRDDCRNNPISGQSGTWTNSRDGWCPGSVEPGLYLDASKYLKNGQNVITVDLEVWSGKTQKYDKYTNYGNYLGGGDGAVLFIGATMFVYDGKAVGEIMKQPKAYTAAEKAFRDESGCSLPAAIKPPQDVNSRFGDSLLQRTATATVVAPAVHHSVKPKHHQAVAALQKPGLVKLTDAERQKQKHESFLRVAKAHGKKKEGDRYNFEEKAPWYLYDGGEHPGQAAGSKVVKVFDDGLIQIRSREIRITVDASKLPDWDWSQAAIHFRLEKPNGMQMDDWDRVGSMGIVFEEGGNTTLSHDTTVSLNPSEAPERKSFTFF